MDTFIFTVAGIALAVLGYRVIVRKKPVTKPSKRQVDGTSGTSGNTDGDSSGITPVVDSH